MSRNDDDDMFNELESLQTLCSEITSEMSLPGYMLEFLGDDTNNPANDNSQQLPPKPEEKSSSPNSPTTNPNTIITNKKAKYDGRTHSLPHQKYGPYTCSKCQKEFATSQVYAAHVNAEHYRHETADERKQRLDAKTGKRKPHLVRASDSQTATPAPPPPPPAATASPSKKMGKRAVTDS